MKTSFCKKWLLLCVSLVCINCLRAQEIKKVEMASNHSAHVVGNDFEGVIFSKDYHFKIAPPELDTADRRFTPDTSQIIAAEKDMRLNMEMAERKVKKPTKDIVIHDKLNYYLRQYFGYINQKQEKVIFINCIWKKDIDRMAKEKAVLPQFDIPDWMSEFYTISNGGTYYFSVKVNLTTHQLFDLGFKGV
jgi:hypothetical protein